LSDDIFGSPARSAGSSSIGGPEFSPTKKVVEAELGQRFSLISLISRTAAITFAFPAA